MTKARFDVYGRYQLLIERHDNRWDVYALEEGKRREHSSSRRTAGGAAGPRVATAGRLAVYRRRRSVSHRLCRPATGPPAEP